MFTIFFTLRWPLSVHQINKDVLQRTLLSNLQSQYSSELIALFLTALKRQHQNTQTVINFKPEILWALSLRLQTFNISYLSLHLKSCVSMWCANNNNKEQKKKKKNTCEEILACEDLKNVEGVHCFYEMKNNQTRNCLEVCRSSDHATNPLLVVLYIRLWMWALQVPPGLRAVAWILLQHQYLQCWQLIATPACLKRPWPAELWTLYHVHSTWTFYIVAPLECGV